MVKVLVHAGFHKTGTTSLQSFFRQNKKALRPYCAYYSKNDFMVEGKDLARIYAQRPFFWRLRRFRLGFRSFLDGIADAEVLVLSRETFCGIMPGHRRLGGAMIRSPRPTALKLNRVIVSELQRRFGPKVKITFIYTTRTKEDWIKSVYGHLLRSIQLRDDFDRFRKRFRKLQSPAEDAASLARALAPIAVKTIALEDYANHREGPAAGVLDLLDLPADLREKLLPAKRSNPGQTSDLQRKLLKLNREISNKSRLKSAKSSLLLQWESAR